MNIASLSQWLQSAQMLIAVLLMLVLATVPIGSLSAQEEKERKESNRMSTLPNGTYLYGQSRQPDQIGQEYIVFEVKDGKLVGALYMPHSEFSCFQGTIQANELAMTVDHPYENTQYPYAIALEAVSPLASRNEQAQAPVTLKGYHPLEEISPNDERMLATCQNEFH
ncbi:MAG: hypothetical protein RI580_07050 [Halothece sp. Uz-M2-17]|nr:hypothetical protein [Halothece sp. Uz-M2-17]